MALFQKYPGKKDRALPAHHRSLNDYRYDAVGFLHIRASRIRTGFGGILYYNLYYGAPQNPILIS